MEIFRTVPKFSKKTLKINKDSIKCIKKAKGRKEREIGEKVIHRMEIFRTVPKFSRIVYE